VVLVFVLAMCLGAAAIFLAILPQD
jgi:hypothetical protein